MRLTIQNKFLGLTILLVLALILLGTLVTESRQRGAIVEELQKRALMGAQSLAASTAEAFLTYNFVDLERVVTVAKRQPDVAYIIVHDKEGKIAAHSHRPDLLGGNIDDPPTMAALRAREPVLQSYRLREGEPPVYEAIVPVFLERSVEKWGTVRVALSSASVVREIRTTRWQLAGFGLAAALAAGLGAVVVAQRITRPIRQLRDGVAAVGRGELDRTIEVTTRDEVHDLAVAFNETTRKLAHMRELEEGLQRANRLAALGTMAAGIAHDVQNPLTAIKMVCRMTAESADDPSTRERFERIVLPGLDRISLVIEDMMELARPSHIALEPTVVNGLLSQTLELFQQQFKSQRIEVVRSLAPDLPTVPADTLRLHRCFANIIQNGIQAMPKGGTLTVSTSLARVARPPSTPEALDGVTPSEECVQVTLADTGRGIPKDVLPHIFDPFFTTKGRGLGLGMAIAHRMIEDHGGRIHVTSEEGQGTVFTIHLPLSPPTTSSPPSSSTTA